MTQRVRLVGIALSLLLAAGIGRVSAPARSNPAETSVDVGFARDMAVHHAQAVAMAEIERSRTASVALRTLATDIALTQQAQIGRMQGWLAAWGRPLTTTNAPMAWMGHGGPMPGMASPAALVRLASLTGAELDRTFLSLMLAHHEGGLDMARAGAAAAERPEVRALARQIVASQQAEIQTLRSLESSIR